MKQYDAIWLNGSIATCETDYGLIKNGAIASKDGKIAWLGAATDLPTEPNLLADVIHDLNGQCLTPGLIDCHTHLVYAGNRAHEFEMRLNGASYEEIAQQGGGIQSTVTATRAASEEELFQQSLPRAKALMQSGATVLEIKSGYGLDLETELKILRVANRIQQALNITVKKTFLGAHTVPCEYRGKSEEYIDLICETMLPCIAKENLADAVDVFCERIAFDLQQTERVFVKARELGLQVKCHAEQLSDSGSAALAAKYQATSVDHLEYLSAEGINAIAASGTVAVLLPGAFYYLRETKYPPLELLREKEIPIAIASDCNPGTSPIMSLLTIMNMACTIFRVTPVEALYGVTKHAAQALELTHSHGTLAVGKQADFAVWNVKHPVELVYYVGNNPLVMLVRNGELVLL